MTAPRSRRAIIPEGRLHGTGPWLVVHARGADTAARAAAVAVECERRGVRTRVLPLDDVDGGCDHAKFRALVLIGENTGLEPATVAAFRDLIFYYRARWSRDLEDLRGGRGDYIDCGVVQLVLPDDGLAADDRRVEALEAAGCVTHRVVDHFPEVLFEAYEGVIERSESSPDEPSVAQIDERQMQRVWEKLQQWGIGDHDEVERAYEIIERYRATYESPRYPALRRPIPGKDRNRLDFVLDDPFFDYPAGPGRAAWLRAGQRVVRDTTAEITAEMPHVGNPRQAKGALPSFQAFYENLQRMGTHRRLGS